MKYDVNSLIQLFNYVARNLGESDDNIYLINLISLNLYNFGEYINKDELIEYISHFKEFEYLYYIIEQLEKIFSSREKVKLDNTEIKLLSTLTKKYIYFDRGFEI